MPRPRKEISGEAVFELARIGCVLGEMGRVLGCDPTTIARRFAAEIEAGRADLIVRLRKKQIDAAHGGNIAMLIWLGKQLVGQRDKSRTEFAAEITAQDGSNLGQMSPEELEARILELLRKGGWLEKLKSDKNE